MQTFLVLTVLAPDRPGLVNELSEAVAAVGGNWLESRMVQLAGQFAGAALVAVPSEAVAELTNALRVREADGLRVQVHPASRPGQALLGRTLLVSVVGQDRPGILRDVTTVLTRHRVTIDELSTEVVSGSFSGEMLFRATAHVRAPEEMSEDDLRRALECLANELIVDVEPEASLGLAA
jgi:glycine cleavage system regulatory protein